MDDRLSFGTGPLGDQPEIEPEEEAQGGRSRRAFVFIAIAMGGLIILGILALVGALFIWVPNQKQAQIARVTQTVVALTREAAAWTPTVTPSPTVLPATWTPVPLPTWTPEPTPTATRVVEVAATPAKPSPTPTKSKLAEWESGGRTPTAGLGGLGTAAIAVGLAGLVFAVRKLRSLH